MALYAWLGIGTINYYMHSIILTKQSCTKRVTAVMLLKIRNLMAVPSRNRPKANVIY